MSAETILKVAVDVPLTRDFDYLPPRGGGRPAPGSRVTVPFGRRRVTGLVMEIADSSPLPPSKLRRCLALLDDQPLFSDDELKLLRFTSDYYHHPVGEVAAAALPALLRQGRPFAAEETRYAATSAGESADIATLARRAPRQAELLVLLIDAGGNGLPAEELGEQLPGWQRIAAGLSQKGYISSFRARPDADDFPRFADPVPGPTLNADQRLAVDAIRDRPGFAAWLLDGVTGSGKTEVYLRIMADIIEAGRQVLVLVPEIGLTPQLVARLRGRLGREPAVLHSGLSDLERLRAWRAAAQGDATLLVGTRSAVFTPLPRLGLVVVDEEHDPSLKQQEGLRYSARDLAIVRAKHRDVPVILGSATPTLESLQHCRAGNYRHLGLARRAGGALPPRVRIVDLNRHPAADGLSAPLAAAIEAQLTDGSQVLVFLNRRGFAPTLICPGCGHVAECRRCDARMTVHARDRSLRCHHCGAGRPLPEHCGECGAAVRPLGAGTQRLEDSLQQQFGGARIIRIDSDSTQHKGAMAEALDAAERGEADILVGTQMLSKGHHFPKLTLVGIVNADQGLFGTDFRSSERLAQSIIQVSGRAGRETLPGEVIIQTAFPAHAFWRSLMEGGYPQVAEEALAEREQSGWPPFSWLALLRAEAHRKPDALAFLGVARGRLESRGDRRLKVLGPVDAPMARRAGRHRAQLLLQSTTRGSLHAALAELRPLLEEDPTGRRVRWSIDVDPIELF